MNHLVTGGAGILGAELVRQRAARGDAVTVYDRAAATPRLAGL
jgi:nucleoside-diphosphate-sugar epimerase